MSARIQGPHHTTAKAPDHLFSSLVGVLSSCLEVFLATKRQWRSGVLSKMGEHSPMFPQKGTLYQ